MSQKITAGVILDALRRRHSGGEDVNSERWAFFDELRFATGGFNGGQAIDAWAMAVWPSMGWETFSYEIKSSRGDFLREIRNPEKRGPALEISNYFYFVTGLDVAKPQEIPEECGWMVVGPHGDEIRAKVVISAPLRKSGAFTEKFVASILRRAARLERLFEEYDENVEKMSKALEFYANPDNWIDETGKSAIIDDMGKTARKARGDPDLITEGGEHAKPHNSGEEEEEGEVRDKGGDAEEVQEVGGA